MYEEIDGYLADLKNITANQLVGLSKYMSMLISQDRPDAQKCILSQITNCSN